MLHPADPSGAGPPPFEKTLPQSATKVSPNESRQSASVHVFTYSIHHRTRDQHTYNFPLDKQKCREQQCHSRFRRVQLFRLGVYVLLLNPCLLLNSADRTQYIYYEYMKLCEAEDFRIVSRIAAQRPPIARPGIHHRALWIVKYS
jgi:hypothetical protein